MRLLVSRLLLKIIGVLAIVLGKCLPRDVDPATGKDKRTGARLRGSG
jgi:hypothetical protein